MPQFSSFFSIVLSLCADIEGMKIIKALVTGIVLTTVVSCSSLEINDNPSQASVRPETIPAAPSRSQPYQSIGIYSDGDPLRGNILLEESLSDAFHKKHIRNLTASHLFPAGDTPSLAPIVKRLKQDNFEAILVIKNLDILSQPLRTPNGTVANSSRSSLSHKQIVQPFRTLTAEIEFIDLSTQNKVWSGVLTFKDASSLPLLIEKTAEGIALHLRTQNIIN